jgi:hypothetical protein
MQKEGFQFQFIHKSVAEFHAACFILRASDEIAASFYSKLVGGKWQKWRQELVFLSQIDRYRYLRHFYVPTLKKTLSDFGVDGDVAHQIGEVSVDLVKARLNSSILSSAPVQMSPSAPPGPIRYSLRVLGPPRLITLTNGLIEMGSIHKSMGFLQQFNLNVPEPGRALGDLMEEHAGLPLISDHIEKELGKLLSEYAGILAELQREEKVGEFISP